MLHRTTTVLALLISVLMAASSASASPPRDVLSVSFELHEESLGIGQVVFPELNITVNQTLANVELHLETDGEVILLSSRHLVPSELDRGEFAAIPMRALLIGFGRSQIDAAVTGRVVETNQPFLVRRTLYLDSGLQGTISGQDGYLNLSLRHLLTEIEERRINTEDGAERARQLTSHRVTTADTRRALDHLLTAQPDRSGFALPQVGPAPSDEVEPPDPNGLQVIVEGSVLFEAISDDDSLVLYPGMGFTVEVWEVDVWPLASLVGVGVTDVDGLYSIQVQVDDINGLPDLQVRTFSTNSAVSIEDRIFHNNYCIESGVANDHSDPELQVSPIIWAKSQFGGAGSVLTGMTFGASAAAQLNDQTFPDQLEVRFPGPDPDRAWYSHSGYVVIGGDFWSNWDTLHHEYFHYFSDALGYFHSPGGDHFIGQCLTDDYGKDDGTRLSLQEATATFLGLASQTEFNMKDLFSPPLEGLGNAFLNLPSGTNRFLEQYTPYYSDGAGEGDEIATVAAMWNLWDFENELNPDGLQLGLEEMFDVLVQSSPIRFASYWSALANRLSHQELLLAGKILGLNDPPGGSGRLGFGSSIESPETGAFIESGSSIEWTAAVGCNAHQGDLFTINFYDSSGTVVHQVSGLTEANYSLSESDIQTISQHTSSPTCVVFAWNTTIPVTGPYPGRPSTFLINSDINDPPIITNVTPGPDGYTILPEVTAVTASAFDDGGIDQVRFYLNGKANPEYIDSNGAPYVFPFDASQHVGELVTIRVVAFDSGDPSLPSEPFFRVLSVSEGEPQPGDAFPEFDPPDIAFEENNGDGDGVPEAGEFAELELRLCANIAVEQVETLLTTTSPNVIITDATTSIPSFTPGECIWTGGFDMEITGPDLNAEFTLHVTYLVDGVGLFTQELSFTQSFPSSVDADFVVCDTEIQEGLADEDCLIDDTVQGGEQVELRFRLQNVGTGPAINVRARPLPFSDPAIELQTDFEDFGDVIVGECDWPESDTWQLETPPDFPSGTYTTDIEVDWNGASQPLILEDALQIEIVAHAWLRVEPETHQFGVLGQGDAFDLPVTIRNMGAAPMEVTGIASSHGDTTFSGISLPTTIAAGDEVVITASINTSSLEGTIERSLIIESDGCVHDPGEEDRIVISGQVSASSFAINQLVDDSSARQPDCHNNVVVYETSRNGNRDIYGFDLNTGLEFAICTDPGNQYSPQIHGDIIIWNDDRNFLGGEDVMFDVYGWDRQTETEFEVATDVALDERVIGIDDDHVAFRRSYEELEGQGPHWAWNIWTYRLSDGQISQLTNWSQGGELDPARSIDRSSGDVDLSRGTLSWQEVVWTWDGNSWDPESPVIRRVQLSSGSNCGIDTSPDTVWNIGETVGSLVSDDCRIAIESDYNQEDYDQIWFWNGGSVQQLTPFESGHNGDHRDPAIGGNFIVYQKEYDDLPGNPDYLAVWDLSSGQESIITTTQPDDPFAVDGSLVVWKNQSTGQLNYTFLGAADLAVTNQSIVFSNDEPLDTDVISVDVIVSNITSADIDEPITVTLYDGDPANGGSAWGSPAVLSDGIDGLSSSTATFNDLPPLVEGTHLVCAVVTPLPNENPSNNTACRLLEYLDSDLQGPSITNVVIEEFNGNGDGNISPSEQIRVTWSPTDPSGIGTEQFFVNESFIAIDAPSEVIFGPLAEGVYNFEISVCDADVTPECTTTFGQIPVIDDGAIILVGLDVDDSTLDEGASTMGDVSLNVTAPEDVEVTLVSSNSSALSVPSSVTISEGGNSASFDLQSHPVTSDQDVTIFATLDDVTLEVSVTVLDVPAGVWIGPDGGSWFNGANWTGGQVPDASMDISIPTTVVIDHPGALAATVIVKDGGALVFDDGSLIASSVDVGPQGVIRGNGTINGAVMNAGRIEPGLSPGGLTINGGYLQSATGMLFIELAGSAPVEGYDQLVVNGPATLDGLLDVSLIGGFMPVLDEVFDVMTYASHTGVFSTVELAELDGTLAFEMSLDVNGVRLDVVDDPVVTFCGVEKYLAPDNPPSADRLGISMDADGDVLIVGAPLHDELGNRSGAAYIYRLIDGTWTYEATLLGDVQDLDDEAGLDVAIDMPWAVVGASHHSESAGRVWVFHHDGSSWTQTQTLVGYDTTSGNRFGIKVEIHDGVIIAGANRHASSSGAAYLFELDEEAGQWTDVVPKLTASMPADDQQFGRAVTVWNGRAVVGAFGAAEDDGDGSFVGAIDIYERSGGPGGSWNHVRRIQPGSLNDNDQFGLYLALHEDTLVVSAHQSLSGAGSAFVYERNAPGEDPWNFVAQLTASDGSSDNEGDRFSKGLAVQGDLIAVGADQAWLDGIEHAGKVYVYERDANDPNSWSEIAILTSLDPDVDDEFGESCAITDSTVLAGAPNDNEATVDAGAFYAFGGLPDVDCNDNGVGDACDIALGDSDDINGNGVPDECEPPLCPADINDDGAVDVNDLLQLLASWGECGELCPSDINIDGVVDVNDLLALLAAWGPCPML